MTRPFTALLDAAEAFARAAQTNQSLPRPEALAAIPALDRLVLAAAILAAADKPVSILEMCRVAGLSRGSAYNHHKHAMERIRVAIPALVRAQLQTSRETPSAAELYERVRDRERAILGLREDIDKLKKQRDGALAYARDLHELLRPEFEAVARERREKVIPLKALRSVPDPVSEPVGDGEAAETTPDAP